MPRETLEVLFMCSIFGVESKSIPVETLAQAHTISGLRAGISQLSGGAA